VEDREYQTEAERDGSGGFGVIDGQWKQDRRFVWNGDAGYLGFERTDDHPVANVSWNDATAFCEWLSEKEGETYHLPSQAQWQYACRAGTTTRWYGTDDEAVLQKHAWFVASSGGTIHLVGQKLANAWGLFDMHGNVWEWCMDYYWDEQYCANSPLNDPTGPDEGSNRVVHGGALADIAGVCRAACRHWHVPSFRGDNLGFRLARTVSSSP
jgi:formylglycine-generating enzyme required for sulfatase activity